MYIYIYTWIIVDLYIDVKQDGQISIGARDFTPRPVRPRKNPNKNRSGTQISYINMGRCPISTWLTSDCVTPIYLYLDTSDNMVSHGITISFPSISLVSMVSLYQFHSFPVSTSDNQNQRTIRTASTRFPTFSRNMAWKDGEWGRSCHVETYHDIMYTN